LKQTDVFDWRGSPGILNQRRQPTQSQKIRHSFCFSAQYVSVKGRAFFIEE
jgi:hypothetical protein